jgi:hypothetical protein
MTIEVMKQELEKNGYRVEKRGRAISEYPTYTVQLRVFDAERYRYSSYCNKWCWPKVLGYIRPRMLKHFGYKNIASIPKERYKEIEDWLLQDAIGYIKKNKAKLDNIPMWPR